MIHKEDDELVAECDDCGLSEYGGTLEFKEFVQQLKDTGWKIRKEDGQWLHRCPDCV